MQSLSTDSQQPKAPAQPTPQGRDQIVREFQKTCGCKTDGTSGFVTGSAVWKLCDYHKEKAQATK